MIFDCFKSYRSCIAAFTVYAFFRVNDHRKEFRINTKMH